MAAASSSARLYFIFSCAVSLWAARLSTSASPPNAAAAPAVDCSSLVLTMADCLSFVSNGSTAEKPEGTCCSGLKSVLKTDAECICEAFRSSAQLGVVLNVTKAMALPAACKVSATSATNCALSIAPASSPAADVSPPESSPASDSSTAPSTTVSSSNEVSTPAPAPVKGFSDASAIVSSFGWLISSAALVSLSLF